jgi:hypothetical protein
MKWLLIVGLTGCAFALAPIMSASAVPAATPYALGATDETGGSVAVQRFQEPTDPRAAAPD